MFWVLTNLLVVSHPYVSDLNDLKSSSGITTGDILATQTDKQFLVIMDIDLNSNDRVVCFKGDLQFSLPRQPEICTASACNGLTMFGPEAFYVRDSSTRDVTIRYYESTTQTEHILWMHDDGGVPQYSNYNGTRTFLRSFTSKYEAFIPTSSSFSARWSIAPWNPCRTTTVNGNCMKNPDSSLLNKDLSDAAYCEYDSSASEGNKCKVKFDTGSDTRGHVCVQSLSTCTGVSTLDNPCMPSDDGTSCCPVFNGGPACGFELMLGTCSDTPTGNKGCYQANAPPPPVSIGPPQSPSPNPTPPPPSPPPPTPPPPAEPIPSPPPAPLRPPQTVSHFIQADRTGAPYQVGTSFGLKLFMEDGLEIESLPIPRGTYIETAGDDKHKVVVIQNNTDERCTLSQRSFTHFENYKGYTIYASEDFTITYRAPAPSGHVETLRLKKGLPVSYSTHHNETDKKIPLTSLPNNTFVRKGTTLVKINTNGVHECIVCNNSTDVFYEFEVGEGYIISPSDTRVLTSP